MRQIAAAQTSDAALVSAALKRVRFSRRLTAQDVATRMNMTLRSYQRFEAGRTPFNLDLIHRFATATDSDPQAVWMGIVIGSSDLALNSADNQFATVLMAATHKFEARIGDRLSRLSTRTIIDAVTTMYEDLARRALDDTAGQWLEDSQREIAKVRAKPGR